MTRPAPLVWAAVRFRDGEQCVICQRRDQLTFQHRQATGMGGSKVPPPCEAGIVLCAVCNVAVERERQEEALEKGWKVRRWVENPADVPVFYPRDLAWFRLIGDQRVQLTVREAEAFFDYVYGVPQ